MLLDFHKITKLTGVVIILKPLSCPLNPKFHLLSPPPPPNRIVLFAHSNNTMIIFLSYGPISLLMKFLFSLLDPTEQKLV